MRDPRLKGKRYIALARCSTAAQAGTSIHDQIKLIRAFGDDEQEMICVGEIRREGLSGSVAANIEQLVQELIERKKKHDDFEVVVVQDNSRFSRSGAKHSAKVRYELEQAGIEVIVAVGYEPPHEYRDLTDCVSSITSNKQARDMAMACARGSQSSLEQRRRTHCGNPPYGVDRLYISAAGHEVHIIRNLTDGTQLRLHPQTGEVLDHYGANQRGQPNRHYKKIRDETVALIPGDPDKVQVVRDMYSWYHADKLGYYAIAARLNLKGIASPTGSTWDYNAIRMILLNTTYRGIGITNRTTTALYFQRSPTRPTAVKSLPESGKTAAGRPPLRIRNRAEWHYMRHERLEEYLPADIRELAAAHQEARLAGDLKQLSFKNRGKRDKHWRSEYVLKDLLRSKQSGYSMTGVVSTNAAGRKYRYYACRKALRSPLPGSVLRRFVPAAELEAAVLTRVRQMLVGMPGIRDVVARETAEVNRLLRDGGLDGEAARQEIATLDRKIKRTLNMDLDDETIQAQLTAFVTRKQTLQEQLVKNTGIPVLDAGEEEAVVGGVIESLVRLGENLDTFPPAQLRQVLACFVESLVVDMETKAVEMVLSVPSWAAGAVCLDSMSGYTTDAETHNRPAFVRLHIVDPIPHGKRRQKAA